MRFTYFSFPVAFSFQSLNSHHFSSFLLNVCLYFYAFYCFVIQSWDSSLTSFLFMWHLLFSHFIIYLPNLLFPYVFLVTNSFFSVFLLIRLLFFSFITVHASLLKIFVDFKIICATSTYRKPQRKSQLTSSATINTPEDLLLFRCVSYFEDIIIFHLFNWEHLY